MKIHLDKAARLFRRYLELELAQDNGAIERSEIEKLQRDVRTWLEQVKPAKGKDSDRRRRGGK